MNGREDETVATLLRLAGPRPAVPEERAARARVAVHEAWREAVRARRRRRVFVLTGAATLAASLAFVDLPRILAPPPGPKVAAPKVATVERALPGAPLPQGRTLFAGDTVETGRGRLALRTTGDVSLRLDEGTSLRLLGTSRVALAAGALYLDAAPGRSGFVVETPLGPVTDEGTQFEGRLTAGGLRLRVREGRVTLHGSGGAERVAAGEELRAEDGRFERARVDTTGPEWAWVEGLARAPAIEGRSLRGFLEWAARERGLTLRFADDDARASAERVRLRGSIEGLTPSEALEAVLPTTGLRARIEGPSLRLEQAR